MNISSIIFNIERILKRGDSIDDTVEITISDLLNSNTDLSKLKEQIQELIDFTLMCDVEIDFVVKDTNKHKRRKDIQMNDCDNIWVINAFKVIR